MTAVADADHADHAGHGEPGSAWPAWSASVVAQPRRIRAVAT